MEHTQVTLIDRSVGRTARRYHSWNRLNVSPSIFLTALPGGYV